MTEVNLKVRPFDMGTPKEAALKPLEEAAEAFGAWQMLGESRLGDFARAARLGTLSTGDLLSQGRLADEIADTIQACCNLAARYDIDLETAMMRCEGRNRARGRYEEGE